MKIKTWFLNQWYNIMKRYASNQIKELKDTLNTIDYENRIYKAWFHILLLLWISEKMPKISIISQTQHELILKIWLNAIDYIYVPVSNYMGVIQNIIKAPKEKENISEKYEDIVDPQSNLNIAHKCMLKEILNRFDK